jgi:NADH-quinone oxidoreductase subunit G
MLRKISHGAGEFEEISATLNVGPVVALVGRTSITEDPRLVEATAAFARTLPDAKTLPLLTRGNVFGALDMGLAPTLLPGRASTSDGDAIARLEDAWGVVPDGEGKDTMAMLAALQDSDLRAVVLAGADPVRDCPDPELAARALDTADFVVAFDAFFTDSSVKADVILPAAVWGEVDGTVTNLEGRVQRVGRSTVPRGQSMSMANAIDGIARYMGSEMSSSDWKLINKEIAELAPAYVGLTDDFLTFEAGEEGAIVPLPDAAQPLGHIPVDVNVPVVTDRFTLHFAPSLYDDSVGVRHTDIFNTLATEASVRLNPRDASSLAVADGDIVAIAGIELPVTIDPLVIPRSAVLPHNHVATKDVPATASVRIETMRGAQ